MKICWRVEDGYVGPDRPHFFEIDDEELEGMDEGERYDYISDLVQQEFENNIYPYWEIDE